MLVPDKFHRHIGADESRAPGQKDFHDLLRNQAFPSLEAHQSARGRQPIRERVVLSEKLQVPYAGKQFADPGGRHHRACINRDEYVDKLVIPPHQT
jgi:hypothetical protein